METTDKNWYVDIDGTVYEATTETIDQWIWDGTVLTQHKVSRGGNRWLEAGRVPQFTGHFENARQMQELMGEGVGVATKMMPPPVRQEPQPDFTPASRPMPSDVAANAQSPFGIRLMGGSAVALLIALAASYTWVYHISAPMDLALINNSREMQVVQEKFDQQKLFIEQGKASAVAAENAPKPRPAGPKLGPAKTGDFGGRGKFPGFQMDIPQYTPPTPAEINLNGYIPKRDFDGELANANAQFEAEKKVVIDNARGAERKSRFIQTLVLLFLGLAGLNLVRISIFPGKK